MIHKFNLSRYRELLKKEKILEEQTNFLFDEPNYLELISYKASVQCQLRFSRRN